jgi:hypothetical protein
VSPSHAYTQGGNYTVTLIVNDGIEDSDPDTAEVHIDPVSITDTVNITKVEYKNTKSILTVGATSSEGGKAELTLDDYGSMVYNSKKDIYILTVKGVTTKPDSVTVTSSEGGFDTAPVTEKAGKNKKKK